MKEEVEREEELRGGGSKKGMGMVTGEEPEEDRSTKGATGLSWFLY